jgi:hypothetical protein
MVAAWCVQQGEDFAELAGELAAQAPGGAAAFAQRDEVPQDVREAQLAPAVVDEEVDGVAIGDDHAAGTVAQQRLRSVAVAAVGDLKQRRLLGSRDRQPLRLPRALPAGLIGTADRALIDGSEHFDVAVLKRVGCLLDERLDRRRADLKAAQIRQQPRGLSARHARRGQRCRGSRDGRPERARWDAGGKLGQRAPPTATACAHPAMLGDLDAHDDLADLVSDRVTIGDTVADLLAAARARRRPVLNDKVGIGDHLTVLTGVPGLTALTAPGLLLGPLLACVRRVARRRQRAVTRGPARLALKLLNACDQRPVTGDQLVDPPRLRLDQRHDRVTTRHPDQLDLITPHTARFPADPGDPSNQPTTP